MGLLIWGLSQCGPLDTDKSNTPIHQQARTQQPTPAPTPPVSTTKPHASPTVGVRYVTATSLNLRQSPDTSGAKISSLPTGTRLQVIETSGQWLKVSIGGAAEGWVHGDYTSASLPRTVPTSSTAELQKPSPLVTLGRSRSETIQLIIARSISAYSGSCPCPFSIDRGGRRCGGRSAHSRAGGARPICFESDVTDAMIRAFLE